VRVYALDVFPGASAIGRPEQSAVAAGSPKRASRCHENDLGIRRIDDHAPDVLGRLEAHVRPRFSAVLRLVDAVAPRCAALIVRLAGADPDDVGIARRDRDVANGC